jgi:hypothetical protein
MIEILTAVVFIAVVAGLVWNNREARKSADLNARLLTDLILRADESSRQREQEWTIERNNLLERIQRPEYIPPSPTAGPPIPDNSIHDELHLVGQVVEGNGQPPDGAA